MFLCDAFERERETERELFSLVSLVDRGKRREEEKGRGREVKVRTQQGVL